MGRHQFTREFKIEAVRPTPSPLQYLVELDQDRLGANVGLAEVPSCGETAGASSDALGPNRCGVQRRPPARAAPSGGHNEPRVCS